MGRKVFVSRRLPREGLAELFSRYEVDHNNYDTAPQRDQLLERVSDVDGLINLGIRVDKALMSQAPKLKVVSNYGAGYDQVDVQEATRRGIIVTNTPNAVTEATAEMAFGLMIAVMRRICEYDRLFKE